MRSVTSCFNPTLYRKNLARFWPLWGAWLAAWLFGLPLNALTRYNNYVTAGNEQEGLARYFRYCVNLNEVVPVIGVMAGAAYAVLVVMAVFGYLYNHRSAAAIHALPLRREKLFITNFLSGLTFMLLPNLAAWGLMAGVEMMYLPAGNGMLATALSAVWQAFWASSAIYVFFYGFAVFCAQFTGNILALPAFYGILNCLVIAMYALISGLGDMLYYGGWPISGEPMWVIWCTPVAAMVGAAYWQFLPWDQAWNTEADSYREMYQLEQGFEDPGLLACYALAGLVLAGLALAVYRRRHIETAGDVVSVKWVRPVFRAGVSVCAGLCGGVLMCAFFGWTGEKAALALCVLLWTVVGYFAAEMLLHKSFRVFKKYWKGCMVTAAAMSLFILGIYMDVLGVETWTPDPREVEWARVDINTTYPLDNGSYMGVRMEEDVQVEKIVDLHKSIIRDRDRYGELAGGDSWLWVRVDYQVGETTYTKRYNMVPIFQDEIYNLNSTTGKVHDFVNDWEVRRRVYSLDQGEQSLATGFRLLNARDGFNQIRDFTYWDNAQEIWAAVQKDFAEGNLGRRYLFDDTVRREETYYTDLQLRFLEPTEGKEQVFVEEADVVYESVYGDVVTLEEGERAWNWSVSITLTPRATHTLKALEQYAGLGDAVKIVTHQEVDE